MGAATVAYSGYLAYRNPSGTAVAALVAVGGVLLILALIGDRISSIKYGNIALSLLERAERAEERGDVEEAERYVATASAIEPRLTTVARTEAGRTYESIVLDNLRKHYGERLSLTGNRVVDAEVEV